MSERPHSKHPESFIFVQCVKCGQKRSSIFDDLQRCWNCGGNQYTIIESAPPGTMLIVDERRHLMTTVRKQLEVTGELLKPTEALVPFGVDDPPDLEITRYELWKCCGCGARCGTAAGRDFRIDKCTCKTTQSGEFVGWVTDGKGCIIVWDERKIGKINEDR